MLTKNQKRKNRLSIKLRSFITKIQNRLAFVNKFRYSSHLKAELSSHQITPVIYRCLNRMTNWQNSQWLRAGAKPELAAHYASLSRTVSCV